MRRHTVVVHGVRSDWENPLVRRALFRYRKDVSHPNSFISATKLSGARGSQRMSLGRTQTAAAVVVVTVGTQTVRALACGCQCWMIGADAEDAVSFLATRRTLPPFPKFPT